MICPSPEITLHRLECGMLLPILKLFWLPSVKKKKKLNQWTGLPETRHGVDPLSAMQMWPA